MATLTAKRESVQFSSLANAEALRRSLGKQSDADHQAELGQFLSPTPIAEFMASLFSTIAGDVRLLDPGAGVGSLTAAFIEDACSRKRRPTSIDVSAYEIDPRLESGLKQTLLDCGRRCNDVGIRFSSAVIVGDYIETMVAKATHRLFEESLPAFTHVIMNPPYKKIRSNSTSRKLLSQAGIETSNLYTAFMLLAINTMERGGEFVSITPRSFCNGPYFRSFRIAFLKAMQLNRLHLFDSRKDAFSDDAVLQENIILSATRSEAEARNRVAISSSCRPSEDSTSYRVVPYETVVAPNDPDLFIHLPIDAIADATAKRIERLPCELCEIGAAGSTGRVVDFRAREYLRNEMEIDTVPLIYPCNVSSAGLNWPKVKTKKPQAIASCESTAKLMVGPGNYVLIKRFTTKEEAKRVVATTFDSEAIGCKLAGFENHLNYFHTNGGSLGREMARGLAAFLNTSTVDSFFRQFRGHTQVNASDLRKLKYPSKEQLIQIGKAVSKKTAKSNELADKVVGKKLGWV